MADETSDQACLSRFIERLGLYFEGFGLPRIAGRLLGLLILTDRPLSLDEIAALLHVSRASVSTNARLLVAARLVERVGLPGDRRDYYASGERGWDAVIETDLETARTLHALAAEALEPLAADESPARTRLQATVEFSRFYADELAATLARWRERRMASGISTATTSIPLTRQIASE